jgi:hypothetical protein
VSVLLPTWFAVTRLPGVEVALLLATRLNDEQGQGLAILAPEQHPHCREATPLGEVEDRGRRRQARQFSSNSLFED